MTIRLWAISVISLTMLAPGSGGQSLSPEARACFANTNRTLALRVKLCTDAIDSGFLSHEELSLALMTRANAFYLLQSFDQAIQDFTQAIQVDGPSVSLLRLRSEAYAGEGNYDRAIQDIDQSIRLKPKEADLHALRGRMQFDAGRYLAAAEDYAIAMKEDPKSPRYAIWRYISEARGGLDARDELEKNGTRLDRRHWPGTTIDLFLGKMGQEEFLASAKDRDKEKATTQLGTSYLYLAECALIAGNQFAAISFFQKSIDTLGDSVGANYISRIELQRLPRENH